MSDISLDFDFGDYALFALLTGWPGLLLGTLCGALAFRKHYIRGALAGALIGWIGCIAIFVWWQNSRISYSTDYFEALLLLGSDALPGVFIGGAIGAWFRRSDRIAGAVIGAIAGAIVWLGIWLLVRGSL